MAGITDARRRMVTDSTDDEGDTGKSDGTSLEMGSDELRARELTTAGMSGTERRELAIDREGDAHAAPPDRGETDPARAAYQRDVADTETDMVARDDAEQGSRERQDMVDARARGEAELAETLSRIDAKGRQDMAERREAEQEQWYPGMRGRMW